MNRLLQWDYVSLCDWGSFKWKKIIPPRNVALPESLLEKHYVLIGSNIFFICIMYIVPLIHYLYEDYPRDFIDGIYTAMFSLQSMVLSFRVSELQMLLGFAGRNKSGRKNELQGRALELLRLRSHPAIRLKIRELYKTIQ